MNQRLRLKVVTPTRVVVDAEADEVWLPGSLGVLGILPGHAPLLALLRIGELEYFVGAREFFLSIQWGFVEVLDDEVRVLAEVAALPSEIDIQAAREAKRAAEEALRTAVGAEFERQRAALKAAITDINVASHR